MDREKEVFDDKWLECVKAAIKEELESARNLWKLIKDEIAKILSDNLKRFLATERKFYSRSQNRFGAIPGTTRSFLQATILPV